MNSSKREYLPDKKKYSNSDENFSERKMMKQFGTPLPFLRDPPRPPSEQFFHDPLFVRVLKTRTPPNFRGEGNYGTAN